MEKAKGMLLNVDIRQQVELLSDEEAGALFKALLAYADEGKAISTENRVLAVVFEGMRAQLDNSAARYEAKCAKNRAIALERERRKREGTNVDERARTYTDVNECDAACTDNTNVTNKIKENEIKENINKKDSYAIQKSTNVAGATQFDASSFVAYFNNRLATSKSIIHPVHRLTPQREGVINARARENGDRTLFIVADKAAESDFLNGKNDRGWLATFDWLMRPTNFVKVLEGNYDNNAVQNGNNVNDLWQ